MHEKGFQENNFFPLVYMQNKIISVMVVLDSLQFIILIMSVERVFGFWHLLENLICLLAKICNRFITFHEERAMYLYIVDLYIIDLLLQLLISIIMIYRKGTAQCLVQAR